MKPQWVGFGFDTTGDLLLTAVLDVKGHRKASGNPHDKLVVDRRRKEEEGRDRNDIYDGVMSVLYRPVLVKCGGNAAGEHVGNASHLWGRTWKGGNLLCTRRSQDTT